MVLGQAVTECSADGVVYGGERLQAKTIIWAAGVRASPAAEWLGAPADRAGRLQVLPDLTVPGHPDIFAIGDTVDDRRPRRQAGARHRAGGQAAGHAMSPRSSRRGCAARRRAPFRYKHAGSLAQIGKRKAVIDFGRIKLRGALAWWIWGIAHIYFLIGLRNRLQRRDLLAVDLRPRSARRAADHAGQQQGGALTRHRVAVSAATPSVF